MTKPCDDAIDVALKVAAALETVGAQYFIGGSLASSIDGEPRATNDIDFVIDIHLGKIHELINLLGPDFEVDADMLRDAILHGSCANAFYLPLVLKVDFFAHAHGPFDEAEFERRRSVVVRDERTLIIKSPEDTILRKLLWYREGGETSDRQWRDIRGVLRGQHGVLDIDYLRHWATKLQLGPLLERAMNEKQPHLG
jgi:hypothetical protein